MVEGGMLLQCEDQIMPERLSYKFSQVATRQKVKQTKIVNFHPREAEPSCEESSLRCREWGHEHHLVSQYFNISELT